MKAAIFLLIGFFATDAFANNSFIPNYYRNRRTPNFFSAVAWSDRNEVRVGVESEKEKTEADGTETNESTVRTLEMFAFKRLNESVNFELGLAAGRNQSDALNPSSPTDTQKYRLGIFGVGYESPNAPIAIGAVFAATRTESEEGTTGEMSHSVFNLGSVGVGYRLGSDYYLGAGVSPIWANGWGEGDTLYQYKVGVGRVLGDRKKADAAGEVTLGYRNIQHTQSYELEGKGLYNQGLIQYYGSVSIEKSEGDSGGTEFDLTTGIDMQFENNWYVGPEISIGIENEDRDTMADEKSSELSVEGGYRQAPYEIYARIEREGTNQSNTAPTADREAIEFTVALGGTYFF